MAYYKIQPRGDTAANWTSADPVLSDREIGLETDTRQFKIGDGATAWTSLSYASNIATDTTWAAKGDLIVASANNTAAVLPVGADNTIFGVETDTPAWKTMATLAVDLGMASYVASGALTAGNANAIAFAVANPAGADVFATKVVVEVTTAGGTAGSLLQVGLADAADGTNIGTEFFPAAGLPLNTPAVYDSWNTVDTGVQTKFLVWESTGTDDYIVGKILTQNAASLVGKYYIFYVLR